ncbi:hypothetical protein Y032_0560g3460 [Ancylostoma ceylanicum]|uniref:Uncharacterized protein n=1 Tax=Ancylostoma ceylanicum TaxID=53326 RepID=A0A016WPY8_9BILA|nr:hypothetical protein Y032_0560g3460 [Ancylostoma ceylanicum]
MSPPSCNCGGGGGGATIQFPALNLPTLDFPTISQPAPVQVVQQAPVQVVSDAPAPTYYVRQPSYRYRQVIIREPQPDVVAPVYTAPTQAALPPAPVYTDAIPAPSFDVPRPVYPPSSSYAIPLPPMDSPRPSYPVAPQLPPQDAPRPSYSVPPPSFDPPRPTYSVAPQPPPSFDAPRPTYSIPPPAQDAPRPSYSLPLPASDSPSSSYSASSLPIPLPSSDSPRGQLNAPTAQQIPVPAAPANTNSDAFQSPPPPPPLDSIAPPGIPSSSSAYSTPQGDAPPPPAVFRVQTGTGRGSGKPQMIVINMPKTNQGRQGRTSQQRQPQMPIVIFLNQQDTNGQSKQNDDIVLINQFERRTKKSA